MDEIRQAQLLKEADEKLGEASTLLLEAFEGTAAWESHGAERRIVGNLQDARSHVSRAKLFLERLRGD